MNEKLPSLEYASPANGKRITVLVFVGLTASLGADIALAWAFIMFNLRWISYESNYEDLLVLSSLGAGIVGAIAAPLAWTRHSKGGLEKIGVVATIIFWVAFQTMFHTRPL
jgi:hypothetical protein